MPLELERHTDPAAFRSAIDHYLRTNLAQCNQLFSITQGLDHDAMRRRQSWLARLHRAGVTCGIALIHSPPPQRELALSAMNDAGVALVAAALQVDGIVPTGVTGPAAAMQQFALRTGRNTVEKQQLGNHVLDTPPCVPACAGKLRAATPLDFELLERWERAFMLECNLEYHATHASAELAARLASARQVDWLWVVDGTPVAMARGNMRQPIARIGMVYTEPTARGRGYAGALVGTLSAQLQAQACDAIFLYTDLSNPTSNGVYRRIGFRRIGQLSRLDFV